MKATQGPHSQGDQRECIAKLVGAPAWPHPGGRENPRGIARIAALCSPQLIVKRSGRTNVHLSLHLPAGSLRYLSL